MGSLLFCDGAAGAAPLDAWDMRKAEGCPEVRDATIPTVNPAVIPSIYATPAVDPDVISDLHYRLSAATITTASFRRRCAARAAFLTRRRTS